PPRTQPPHLNDPPCAPPRCHHIQRRPALRERDRDPSHLGEKPWPERWVRSVRTLLGEKDRLGRPLGVRQRGKRPSLAPPSTRLDVARRCERGRTVGFGLGNGGCR